MITPLAHVHPARPRARHTLLLHICTVRPREVHILCCLAVLVVRGGREARPDQAASREASPEPAASPTPKSRPARVSFLAPSSLSLSPHVVCAAGDSPPFDQVARRLLRAGVRRRRNLAVVTRSQVRRGHDRRLGVRGRFAAVYLRVL
eukprot:scaffold118873_cov60-Phaeocystis_antarctica.AAC.2